jgi:hypothetical protein
VSDSFDRVFDKYRSWMGSSSTIMMRGRDWGIGAVGYV